MTERLKNLNGANSNGVDIVGRHQRRHGIFRPLSPHVAYYIILGAQIAQLGQQNLDGPQQTVIVLKEIQVYVFEGLIPEQRRELTDYLDWRSRHFYWKNGGKNGHWVRLTPDGNPPKARVHEVKPKLNGNPMMFPG